MWAMTRRYLCLDTPWYTCQVFKSPLSVDANNLTELLRTASKLPETVVTPLS